MSVRFRVRALAPLALLCLFAMLLFASCGDSNTGPSCPSNTGTLSLTHIGSRNINITVEVWQGNTFIKGTTVAPRNSASLELPVGNYTVYWQNIWNETFGIPPRENPVSIQPCQTSSISLS